MPGRKAIRRSKSNRSQPMQETPIGNAPSRRAAASSVDAVIMTATPSGSACMAWRKRARLRAASAARAFQRATFGLLSGFGMGSEAPHGPVVDRLDGERVAGPHAPHGIQRAVQVVESDAMDAVRHVMRQTAGHGDEPTAARASLKPLEQGSGAFAAVSADDDQIGHAFRLCRPDA